MAVSINQTLPNNFNPSDNKDFKTPVVKKDTITNKIDLCSSNTYKDMLNDLPLPNIDFPKINSKMFSLPTLPTFNNPFSKSMFNNINLKGLSLPFKCNLSSLNKPDFASLHYKKDYRKLGDRKCNDNTGGTNSNKVKSNVMKTLSKTDNCAKEDKEVITDTANNIMILAGIDTPDNRLISSSIISAMIDDKFDIGTASKLINNPTVNKQVTESIKLSPTNKNKLFKVSKNIFKEKDKEFSLIYATSIASNDDLTKDNSDIIKLSESASKDTTLLLNGIPSTKTLSTGQRLNIISKVKKLSGKKIPFGIVA